MKVTNWQELVFALKDATTDQQRIDTIVQFAKDEPHQSTWGMMLSHGMTEETLRNILLIDVSQGRYTIPNTQVKEAR